MGNMKELYDQTRYNCELYRREYVKYKNIKNALKFMSEVGCLRGIAYCIESTGLYDIEVLHGLESLIGDANYLYGQYESHTAGKEDA